MPCPTGVTALRAVDLIHLPPIALWGLRHGSSGFTHPCRVPTCCDRYQQQNALNPRIGVTVLRTVYRHTPSYLSNTKQYYFRSQQVATLQASLNIYSDRLASRRSATPTCDKIKNTCRDCAMALFFTHRSQNRIRIVIR